MLLIQFETDELLLDMKEKSNNGRIPHGELPKSLKKLENCDIQLTARALNYEIKKLREKGSFEFQSEFRTLLFLHHQLCQVSPNPRMRTKITLP